MEFGLLPNWSWPRAGSANDQMRKTLEQVEAAIDADYDAVWFGQHYLSEGNNQFQPLPLLSRAAGLAGETDLGTSIFLLPLHNPVAVAENVATADALFDGELRFGVALGYKDAEFEAFGIDKDERLGRFVEGVQLLRRLWTEDDVSFSGEHFEVDGVTIDPKPNGGRGVPIPIGGNAEGSVERAGRLGDGWIISARTPYREAERLSEAYEAATERSPHPSEGIALNREVYVADTTEEAVETVAPMMKERAAAWLERGAEDTAEQVAEEELEERVHEMLEERFVGSPEEVIDRIADFRDGVGVDHVIGMYNWRQLSQEKTLASIRRFSEEVIPYFEAERSDS